MYRISSLSVFYNDRRSNSQGRSFDIYHGRYRPQSSTVRKLLALWFIAVFAQNWERETLSNIATLCYCCLVQSDSWRYPESCKCHGFRLKSLYILTVTLANRIPNAQSLLISFNLRQLQCIANIALSKTYLRVAHILSTQLKEEKSCTERSFVWYS
jgi:hypothetical protein